MGLTRKIHYYETEKSFFIPKCVKTFLEIQRVTFRLNNDNTKVIETFPAETEWRMKFLLK